VRRFAAERVVDGRSKYRDDPEARVYREKLRQERLEDAGLVITRWGRADLCGGARCDRLQRTFARDAAR
jgi:hypothetical protein